MRKIPPAPVLSRRLISKESRVRHRTVIAIALCVLASASVLAQSGLFLVPSPTGALYTWATDINARGQIVGFFGTRGGTQTFLFTPGRQIQTFNIAANIHLGLNDRGDVVGTRFGPDSETLGHFIIKRGRVVEMLDMDPRVSFVADINSQGTIVANIQEGDSCSPWHGAVLSQGTLTLIDNPWGFPITIPTSIANDGTIVGRFGGPCSDDGMQGFIYRQGQWTILNYPGSDRTGPNGVASNGWIVGSASMIDGEHRFAYRDGEFRDLAPNFWPFGVNAAGWVVGVVTEWGNGRAAYQRVRF